MIAKTSKNLFHELNIFEVTFLAAREK